MNDLFDAYSLKTVVRIFALVTVLIILVNALA